MRAFSLLVVACWATVVALPEAGATPLKNPKRLVHNQTVDLAPLFKWWSHRDGPRPLTAWVQVTGTIKGTNSLGWVLERGESGGTGSSASRTIVLRNPPAEDLADFQKLLAEAKSLKDQRAKTAAEQDQARNAADRIAKQRTAPRTRAVGRVLAAENRQVKAVESEDKKRLSYLDGKIREVNSKLAAYPKPEHYVVDCFALDTGERSQATPVYDHGFIVK